MTSPMIAKTSEMRPPPPIFLVGQRALRAAQNMSS